MHYIDKFLNRITMYRLVMYGLAILALISVIFGFTGLLLYSGVSLICSFFILAIVCYGSNQLFAKIFKVQTNIESEWITGFILFFVAFPAENLKEAGMLALLATLAMASKYIFVIKKEHVFNPAAISVFLFGLFGSGIGAWWVGSSIMLLPVIILGFLVLRKVERFHLFSYFLLSAVVSIVCVSLFHGGNLGDTLKQIFTSWPIFFFGSIMLTEPLTIPPNKRLQIIYGILVGILFGLQFHLGPLYSTPEFALIIGNIFAFIVSPRSRRILTLIAKNKITEDIYDFVWQANQKLNFKPGQYMEWTLGHKSPDGRGNRRYFTIASSPTESHILLGTKFHEKPSTWKKKLLSLLPGDSIVVAELAGDFILPEDQNKKLVFIAGGIGITPFRSMAKYLIDKKEKRNIFMLYSNKTPRDLAYKDIFDIAEREVSWKNIYVVNELTSGTLSPNMRVGFITREMIQKEIPDYKDRMYYISGTHGMVTVFEEILGELGVVKSHIKTDFFPGFV